MTSCEKLAAGGGSQGGWGARRPRRRSGSGRDVPGFRERKKRDGANVGDRASMGKRDGDRRGRDVIGKFGDDENIEGTEGEERGLELAA